VHKLRNLERKAPKHALAELRADFHRIVYAASAEAARTAYTAFERKWEKRCPAVAKSLRRGRRRATDLLHVSQGAVEDCAHHQRDRAAH
jgi:transposase-like protein